MTMLERLLHGLTLEGSVIQRDSDDGPFLITVYEGRRLDPPSASLSLPKTSMPSYA